MLHLIPAPLHRALYRLAHALRKRWLRLSQAEVHGCTVIARDAEGRFLLVLHSYGAPYWSFPGGGMHKNEDALAAALREFREEVGCELSDPQFLGLQEDIYHGTKNHVRVFTGLIDGQPQPDMREIVEAKFFASGEFPRNCSRVVPLRLKLLPELSQQR